MSSATASTTAAATTAAHAATAAAVGVGGASGVIAAVGAVVAVRVGVIVIAGPGIIPVGVHRVLVGVGCGANTVLNAVCDRLLIAVERLRAVC